MVDTTPHNRRNQENSSDPQAHAGDTRHHYPRPYYGGNAQDAQSGYDLPEICTSGAHHEMGAMDSGHDMTGSMDEAHKALMTGMDEMNAKMMQGMMAPDPDVAFVCGMLPHHQGAIDMAKAELAHGDDQWAKDQAQRIIDAQEKEISEMKAWLAEQPGK